MAKQLKTTELDFDKIKDNIKTFFKRTDSPFKDLDFDGSGLNQILDILAYNTHYNAVNAHMSVNESFLDTAQIRSNVVSHAKLIGYVPQSRLASTASLNLRLDAGGQTAALSIPEGTSFTGKVDGVTYTFKTTSDSANVLPVNGEYVFNGVTVREGTSKTKRFVYNNLINQQFIIDDKDIDKTSLVVRVKENESALDSTARTYSLFAIGDDVQSTSEVYYIYENYEGFYQIEFGDDVLGKKPSPGAVIICEYVSTQGEAANDINVFSFGTYGGDFPIDDIKTIETASKSAFGAERNTIENIKFNAPISFISKNRAVTTNDYTALINERFGNIIQDILVFGGQDTTPPQYGKVFIAIKPKGDEDVLTDLQKSQITDFLKNKKIIAIDTEVVDPDITFVFFNLSVKFDKNKTGLSENQLASRAETAIVTFNNSFEEFNNDFRYSTFLKAVDETDVSVLNSLAQVFCYKKFNIAKDNTQVSNVNFRFNMFGDAGQTQSFISTTTWEFNSLRYELEDRPIANDTTKRRLKLIRITNSNERIATEFEAGFLYPATGLLEINPLPTDADSTIEITATPRSYNISSSENNILSLDLNKTNIQVTDKDIITSDNIIRAKAIAEQEDAAQVTDTSSTTITGGNSVSTVSAGSASSSSAASSTTTTTTTTTPTGGGYN